VDFEWDNQKAGKNLAKHRVSFEEAATVFSDPQSVTASDPDDSIQEDRFLIVDHSAQGRLLIVAHSGREDRVRIISARELTRTEREAYEEEITG
jgi:hypothetical protein